MNVEVIKNYQDFTGKIHLIGETLKIDKSEYNKDIHKNLLTKRKTKKSSVE